MSDDLLDKTINLDSKQDIVEKYLNQVKDQDEIEEIVDKALEVFYENFQNLNFDLNEYYDLEIDEYSFNYLEGDSDIAQRLKDAIGDLDFQIDFDYRTEVQEYSNPYTSDVKEFKIVKILDSFNFDNYELDLPNYLVFRLVPKNNKLPIGELVYFFVYSENKILVFEIYFLFVRDGKGGYKEIRRSFENYEIISYDNLKESKKFSKVNLIEKLVDLENFITDYMISNYIFGE